MQNTKIVKLTLAILNAASMEATFAGGPSGPQENLLQDSGSWEQVYLEGSLGVVDPSLAKARIWLEAQSRTDNNFTNEYQGLARVGLGYSVTDRATIWGGYTYLPTDNITAATPHAKFKGQQDAFSAFRYVIPTSFGTLSFRTMFEANFLPYNNNEVRYRPRQRVKFMHPMEFEPRLSVIGVGMSFFFEPIRQLQAVNQVLIKIGHLQGLDGLLTKTSVPKAVI